MQRFVNFRDRLGTPEVTRWLWLLALALSLPVLGLGHVLDDLQQQAMVRGTYDSAIRTPAELYCFSLGPGLGLDPSLLSFWDDADSRLCFPRPLSSWSLWLDQKFFWDSPAVTHAHSLLWFMGLWFGWRRILLRYLPAQIGNLALLLVAASGFVSFSTAWIAARHALVGGCLAVWGLWYALTGRDERRSAREWLGYALIGVALLASEMALGAFGFLVAREWFAKSERSGTWPRLVGYAVAGLAYVGTHASLGYGARNYPMYLEPFGEPRTFLLEAPERLLALTGELILGLPSEMWLYPSLRPWVAIICVLSALCGAIAIRDLWRIAPADLKATLRWLCVGGVFSLAPCLSGMQGGRSLVIAGFPFMALIGACFLLRRPESSTTDAGTHRWLRALPVRTLVAGAFIGNPIVHLAWYGVVAELDASGEKGFERASVDCPAASDVYLIDASQLGAAAWYARYWLQEELGAKNFRQLTMIPTGITGIELSRTGPSRMTLRGLGGPLVGPMAMPPGDEGKIQAGFERQYRDYQVKVTRVGEHGPTEVEYGFTRTLDSRELCLFAHDDTGLYQLKPPSVGSSKIIPTRLPL